MSVRRRAALVAPAAVSLSMAAVFAVLRRLLPPASAYNVGFAIYWAGWCLAFPLWVLGPDRAFRILTTGRARPDRFWLFC